MLDDVLERIVGMEFLESARRQRITGRSTQFGASSASSSLQQERVSSSGCRSSSSLEQRESPSSPQGSSSWNLRIL